MVGHTYSFEGESTVIVAIGRRIVADATDIGVMVIEERASGDFSPCIYWLDFCFYGRINKKESIFLMEIMNRDRNMLYLAYEVV